MKADFHDEFVCACGLNVNTCSIWDPSTSWTRCRRTTSCQLCHTCRLWSLQQLLPFPLATYEQCASWCGTHDIWGNPERNNHRYSCPVNRVARTIHTRSALEMD